MSAIRGNNLRYAEVGAAAASGLHTILKPTDPGALGHYRIAVQTGAIAAGAAADSEIVQFRWSDATKLCVLKRVVCTGIRTTTAFAAGTADLKMTLAKSFTAVGSGTGSTTTAPITLASTSVNGAGVLTFTALSVAPKVGQAITINGTMSTGTINGSATQTNAVYYVIGTPTTTTATLSLTQGGSAVASTASTGAFTGCTSTLASTLSSSSGKMRSSFSDSAVPTIVTAGTAALSAGTKILDFVDTTIVTSHTSAGTGSATPIIGNGYMPIQNIYEANIQNGEYPIVFAQNEGFVLRATVPATGVWAAGFAIQWAEVEAY